jgi:hypothetical protein
MRKIRRFMVLIIVFLAFLSVTARGEDFCVSTTTELQDALTDAQANGEADIIMIKRGTYNGSFVYQSNEGHSITLLGGYGTSCAGRVLNPLNTILDAAGTGQRVLLVENNGGGDIFIEGITVRNGNESGFSINGGGIYAYTAPSGKISIRHSIIEYSKGFDGGGIYAVSFYVTSGISGDIDISHNIIRNNTAKNSLMNGGGVVDAASITPDGIAGDVFIKNNLVLDNIGSGVTIEYINQSRGRDNYIINNTFVNNSGYGVYVRAWKSGFLDNHTDLYNNVFWNNGIYIGGDTVSNVYNNDYPGGESLPLPWDSYGGNIDRDPRFVGGGNYHLNSDSPCIDTGTNSAPHLPPNDLDRNLRVQDGNSDGTSTVDMGAYEFVGILPIFHGHDFDGNGSSDVSVWRPTNGRWYIRGIGSYVWGAAGDIPANGDYDGDGTTDIAVWRPSNGRWYLRGIGGATWGTAGDIPVPGDYNGDGSTDIAVWRPSNGRWYIMGVGSYIWGTAGDIPVPGDYNKDGKTEIAVWRPSNGRWYIKGSAGSIWGASGDFPVPADYDGDGTTDIAVWRPSNGRWYIKGLAGSIWGTVGDIPVPGDYNGGGATDIAVWRPSNGRWYIKGIAGYLWGTAGDIPVVR